MTTKVIISTVEGNGPIRARIELLNCAKGEWQEEQSFEIPVNGCLALNVWTGRRIVLSEAPIG